ncbi:hypothetical protein ACSBR2_027104 [Camellia fascicularis]
MCCQSIVFILVLILILLRMTRIVSLFIVREGLIWDVYGACMLEWKILVKLLMTSSMIGGLISSEVRNKALTSVSEVVCDFKDYYGTEVSYR